MVGIGELVIAAIFVFLLAAFAGPFLYRWMREGYEEATAGDGEDHRPER